MANETMLAQMINPQVMADMITAKVDKKVRVLPYAKVDTTLQGQAGDTITVPCFKWIGEAVDVAEGAEIPIRQMGTDSKTYKIKMAGLGISLTDMAVLSGKGDPIGQANTQLANSISAKCDADAMNALYEASTTYTHSGVISYNGVVSAVDLFNEEVNSEKVMFVNPKQTTQLRKDPDFISRDKYGNQVMMDGEIGMIANTRIVPSKRVKLVESKYVCPIIKLNEDTETEDETSALTYFLKRDTNVETERKSRARLTEVTVDRVYTVALTNDTKVVLAKFDETARV